jgi:hypothetical protein
MIEIECIKPPWGTQVAFSLAIFQYESKKMRGYCMSVLSNILSAEAATKPL